MATRLLMAIILLATATVCLGQDPATPPALGYKDSFQTNFVNVISLIVANGDSPPIVNITNVGFHGLPGAGDMCANIYTFRPDQVMLSCCSCIVGPNALVSLAAPNLLPPVPAGAPSSFYGYTNSVLVKIVSTLVQSRRGSPCDAAFAPTGLGIQGGFATGMRAWASHTPVLTYYQTNGGLGIGGTADTAFLQAPLSQTELGKLISSCSAIPLAQRCTCGYLPNS